ncbi:MAG TPA: hypothetical protein VGW75_09130 [Solirubrobacteraceae bacterium]|jgi:hypothetical protein|nr:hypothetical protein [Solirubrobacteraceae bacterium]
MRRARVLLGCAAAAAVAAPVVLAARDEDDDGGPRELPRAFRDCAERAEAAPIRPRAGRDAVIGPIAFYEMPTRFDPGAQRRGRVGRVAAPPMKALAIVRPGHTVTVSVPPEQRPWMRLFYEGSAYGGAEGSHVVTFRACPRRWTQFPGEIAVDYAAAPDEGRCARLAVTVGGGRRGLTGRLFDPAGERCGG